MTTPAIQKLEQYKQTLEQVKARRTQIQIKLESARQQYQAAAEEAKAEHGTDSLPRLTAKLAQMEANNEEAAQAFVTAVDEFNNYITQIEQALTSPDAMTEWLAKQPTALTPAAQSTAVKPSASSAPKVAVASLVEDDDI